MVIKTIIKSLKDMVLLGDRIALHEVISRQRSWASIRGWTFSSVSLPEACAINISGNLKENKTY